MLPHHPIDICKLLLTEIWMLHGLQCRWSLLVVVAQELVQQVQSLGAHQVLILRLDELLPAFACLPERTEQGMCLTLRWRWSWRPIKDQTTILQGPLVGRRVQRADCGAEDSVADWSIFYHTIWLTSRLSSVSKDGLQYVWRILHRLTGSDPEEEPLSQKHYLQTNENHANTYCPSKSLKRVSSSMWYLCR